MAERTGIITMKGNPLTLLGNEVTLGDPAPEAEILNNDLASVTLSSYRGKVCIGREIRVGRGCFDH